MRKPLFASCFLSVMSPKMQAAAQSQSNGLLCKTGRCAFVVEGFVCVWMCVYNLSFHHIRVSISGGRSTQIKNVSTEVRVQKNYQQKQVKALVLHINGSYDWHILSDIIRLLMMMHPQLSNILVLYLYTLW